jgi:hypothetical protein
MRKKNKKAVIPDDYRSTVFWNGNLLTADANNSTISFYTSDIPSVYNVTVTALLRTETSFIKQWRCRANER